MKVRNSDSSLQTFGCGTELNHSNEEWCVLIRQAWLKGFLSRLLAIGSGHNMMNDIAFATYTVVDTGIALLKNVELKKFYYLWWIRNWYQLQIQIAHLRLISKLYTREREKAHMPLA